MMEYDAESRYKSLLQPIRDLASNWDVDIAESLEEYLDDLESIQVTLDGGSTHINFAEAALLIQGSTAVYSKKVEYLHGLVLQALELITQQRSGANGKRGADKNGDKGGASASLGVTGNAGKEKAKLSVMEDERFLFGSDPTYLLLDDCVEEAMNIDLAAAVDLKEAPDSKIDATQLPQGRGDLARSSMALMHSIMARDHGGGNQLNMASCLMSSTGALLMGGLAHVGGDCDKRPAYEDDGYDEVDDFGPGPGHFYDDGGDDDDDGYFAGAAEVDDDNGSGNNNNNVDMESTNVDSAADSDANAQPAPAPAVGAGKPAAVKAKVQAKAQAQAAPVDRDPLALLDPHEALSGSRPAKRGMTFRLPASLVAAAASAPSSSSSARASKGKAKAASKANQAAVVLDLFTSLLQGTVSQQPKAVLHDCFAPLVRAQRRARLSEARAKAREGGRGGRSAAAALRIDDFIYAADDDADFGGAAGLGGDDDVFADADAGAAFWGGDDDDDLDAPYEEHEGQQFPLSLMSEEEELHRRMQRVLDEGLQQAGQSNYEVLCRRHVDAFLRGAEQYARCVPIPISLPTPLFLTFLLFSTPSTPSTAGRRSCPSACPSGRGGSSPCCKRKRTRLPLTSTTTRTASSRAWAPSSGGPSPRPRSARTPAASAFTMRRRGSRQKKCAECSWRASSWPTWAM